MTKREVREYSRKLKQEISSNKGLGNCPATLEDLDILVQVVYKMLPQGEIFNTKLYKEYSGLYAWLCANSSVLHSLKQTFLTNYRGRLVCITTRIDSYKRSGNEWVPSGSRVVLKSLEEVRKLERIHSNRANSDNFTRVRIKHTTGSKIRSQYVPDNLILPSKLSSASAKGDLTDTYITFYYETARVF